MCWMIWRWEGWIIWHPEHFWGLEAKQNPWQAVLTAYTEKTPSLTHISGRNCPTPIRGDSRNRNLSFLSYRTSNNWLGINYHSASVPSPHIHIPSIFSSMLLQTSSFISSTMLLQIFRSLLPVCPAELHSVLH
jgi:hypothetical protein